MRGRVRKIETKTYFRIGFGCFISSNEKFAYTNLFLSLYRCMKLEGRKRCTRRQGKLRISQLMFTRHVSNSND